jgi:TRAP-type transport system periplasmic protein
VLCSLCGIINCPDLTGKSADEGIPAGEGRQIKKENIMKKLVATLMAACMMASLTACGSSSSSTATTTAAAAAEETTAEAEAAEAAATEEYPEYHWNAGMTVADTTINYMMVEKFAQLLDEKTGGKITVELYPSGQLGNTTEFTEAVISGSIDIGTGMTTDLVDFIPTYAIFDIPNLFDNVEQMRAVLNSDFTQVLNEYNNQGGIQMLGYSDAGFRQLSSNKAVHQLSDLAGQKIRVMTNQYHLAYWNALGAAATPMQFTEVFMGLQQGTIDGEENPYMNIVGNNFQEVQKYIIETNHIGHIITFFMNNDLYQGLPENVKTLVDECAAEAVDYANSKADESIAEYKKICEDAGCEIITLDADVLAQFKEKASVVTDMVRENVGDDIVDQLMSAIDATK